MGSEIQASIPIAVHGRYVYGLSIAVGGNQYDARWATIEYYKNDRMHGRLIDRCCLH